MELFAWFKTHGLTGRDGDLGPGAGIASDSRFSGAHCKDAEAAQLDAVSGGKRFFQAVKHLVHCRLGLIARQSGPLNHVMDNVLFYQGVSPSTAGIFSQLPDYCGW